MSKIVPDLVIDIILCNPNKLPKHKRNWVKRLQRKLDEKHTDKIVASYMKRDIASGATFSMGCAVEEPSCSQCGENTSGEEFGVRLANMTDQEKTAISMAGMDIIHRRLRGGPLPPIQQLPDDYFTDHETIANGSTGNS